MICTECVELTCPDTSSQLVAGVSEIISDSVTTTVPPPFDDICAFMAKYAGKYPPHPLCGIPPYQYSGRDYAIALYACMPSIIDLSLLSWTSSPLAAQRTMNLNVFCRSAARLEGSGAPIASLHPSLLQPTTKHLWHHLIVQHWLYELSRRHPPSHEFNASATRLYYRQQQLGEPFPTTSRNAFTSCTTLETLKPLDESILAVASPYLHALSPLWRDARPPASDASTAVQEGASNNSREQNKKTDEKDKTKPWLSYSKPWNLPAINAAKAKKARMEAVTKRRLDAARQAGAKRRESLWTSSESLGHQFRQSAQCGEEKRRALVEIRRRVTNAIMRGEGMDFSGLACDLEKMCLN